MWRILAFAAFSCASILVFSSSFIKLTAFAFNHESYSHIVLIPFLSAYLVYRERQRIFDETSFSPYVGCSLALASVILLWLTNRSSLALNENDSLSRVMFFFVCLWIAGFVACFGTQAFRRALFPLLLLFFMVPIPTLILDRVILFLQEGSTYVTSWIFRLFGVPLFREGFYLSLPGVTIEVAKECSGIRSTLALLISCLLAANLFLRTNSRRLAFILLVVPMSLVKNAIRIATLTLLGIYVNPGFLTGNLHHRGGIVFFLIALAFLSLALWGLRVSERAANSPGLSAATSK